MKNPISSRPLVLAGNALSVLIAATERAHKGLPTTIINTGGPLGGYFAGIDALGAADAAVSAAHRKEALRVLEDVVEKVKLQLPVWKRQFFADGTSEWTGAV